MTTGTQWLHHANTAFADIVRDVPDSCRIKGLDKLSEDDDHTRWVHTCAEMIGLLAVEAHTHGWFLDWQSVQRQAQHEEAHAIASRALGFTQIRYGLGVWHEGLISRWQFAITQACPITPPTKLAYASVWAAPVDVSDGDNYSLRLMGYRDAADVLARVSTWNASHKLKDRIYVPNPVHG